MKVMEWLRSLVPERPIDLCPDGRDHVWEQGIALDETGGVAEWDWCTRCGKTVRW